MKKVSISENTGIEYQLPLSSIDPHLLEFLDQSAKSKSIIVVQGLGFVGLAMSIVIANAKKQDYTVIGVDQPTKKSYWKICEINSGTSPVKSSDPLFEKYFRAAKMKKNFYATYDTSAYKYADTIIVDVNLDVDKQLDSFGSLHASKVPLDGFKNAMRSIGENCKEDVHIIIETTVPPGTCSRIVKPIISEMLNKRGLSIDKFCVGHSYERVMPGPNYINSIKNFYRVFSGVDQKSALKTRRFLETVISTKEYPLTQLDNTESTEMAKVLENSYRALNISFIVEWSRFAEAAGVNLYDVVRAIRLRPTHANIMLPGIGVGGYCLTKDPVMASWASREFFGLKEGLNSSVNAVKINDQMPEFAYNFCMKCFSASEKDISSVSLLGVAYAPGIGDTRNSPVEAFARQLEHNNFSVEYHDPYVSFWREMSKDINTDMYQLTCIKTDAVIVTTGHQKYVRNNVIYKHLSRLHKPILIDTVGLLDFKLLDPQYKFGENFFVLGVGN